MTTAATECKPLAVGAQPTVEKKDLLDALQDEIRTYEEGQRNSGWTRWALVAGIGAVLWNALKEMQTVSLDYGHTVAVAMWSCLVLDSVAFLFMAFFPPTEKGTRRHVLTFSYLLEPGPILFYALLRSAGLIAAAIWLRLNQPEASWIYVCWFYGTECFFALGAIAASTLDLGVSQQHHSLLGRSLGITIAALTLMVLALTIQGVHHAHNFDPAEVRVGILAAVVILLADWILRTFKNDTMIDTLRRIKRGLAFGLTTPERATSQAEIAIMGMKVADYLQPSLQKCLAALEKLGNEVDEIGSCFRMVRGHLEDWVKRLPTSEEEHRDRIRMHDALLGSIAAGKEKNKQLSEEYQKACRSFNLHRLSAVLSAPDAQGEINTITGRINSVWTALNAKSKSLIDDIKALDERRAAYKAAVNLAGIPKKPRLDNGTSAAISN